MSFYPGTHPFGDLGDASEPDPDVLASDWAELTLSLEPEDVAFTISFTWHRSGPRVWGPERLLADNIHPPADDPRTAAKP